MLLMDLLVLIKAVWRLVHRKSFLAKCLLTVCTCFILYEVISRRETLRCQASPTPRLDPKFRKPFPRQRTHYTGGSKTESDGLMALAREYSNLRPRPQAVKSWLNGFSRSQILSKLATSEKKIMIVSLDKVLKDMAVNFFIMSIAGNKIDNYLLVGAPGLCERFSEAGLNCIDDDPMEVILAALNDNFKVIYTTLDVQIFADPFLHITCDPSTCNVAAITDDGQRTDANFMFTQPLDSNVALFEKLREDANSRNPLKLSTSFNASVQEMRSENLMIRIQELPRDKFQHGLGCNEQHTLFADRPLQDHGGHHRECIVVRNNEAMSASARIYQARELHQWMDDAHMYYTSSSRKYLLYHNPLQYWDIHVHEINALKNAMAIGRILGRIVILPRFHYYCEDVPLTDLLDLERFDAVFAGQYRESTFLSHPLVNDKIQHSISKPFLIKSDDLVSLSPTLQELPFVNLVQTTDPNGMTEEEIKGMFGDREDPVLQLFALYHSFASFESTIDQQLFDNVIEQAFVKVHD